MVRVGDRVLCFDPYLWRGHDRGDNADCFKPATIEAIRAGWGDTDVLYDVRFDHRPERISSGHYPTSLRTAPPRPEPR